MRQLVFYFYLYTMHLDNDKLKQSLFLVTLFILGGFLFYLLRGFLSSFLGAVVIYVLLRQPFFYLTQKTKYKWNKPVATVVLMGLSFVVLVLPVFLVSVMLSGKVSYLFTHYEDILALIQDWSNSLQQYIGVDLLSADMVGKLTGIAANVVPQFISATANAVADVFVLYFLLFFMLVNAGETEKYVRSNMPFHDENDRLLLTELKTQTVSNAIGIPVIAMAQGIAAGLGYWIFGVDEPFFWAVISALFSVIPVIGATVVWVPLAVFLYAGGHQWQALALAVYFVAAVGTIDNVLRFALQKKLGDTHPLITFFGVVIGLPLFGFIGLIFGPLLISYFILLLKIYRNEYLDGTG